MHPTVMYADQVVYVDSNLTPHTPETVLTENIIALAMKLAPWDTVIHESPYMERQPFSAALLPTDAGAFKIIGPSIGIEEKYGMTRFHTGERIVVVLDCPEHLTRAARIAYLAYRESIFEHTLVDLI